MQPQPFSSEIDHSLPSPHSFTDGPSDEAGVDVLRELHDARETLKEKDAAILQLRNSVRELASRLRGVSQFIDLREDIEERLNSMATSHAEQVEQLHSESREARLDLLENRVHIRSVEQALRDSHAADINRRALQLLDDRTKEVNMQNFNLVRDKLVLAKNMEDTRQKCIVLEDRNVDLRRKVDLSSSSESELIARSVRQKREIERLKGQIKITEENMTTLENDYEQRLTLQEKSHVKEVRQLMAERNQARVDAQTLRRELQQLRKVSAKVVEQRGELEMFFYAALQEVREHIAVERQQRILAGGSFAPESLKAAQTTSSSMRLAAQDRLQITDYYGGTGSLYPPSPSRRAWDTDSKGFPVLRGGGKVSGKALPPIPGSTPSGASGRTPNCTLHSTGDDNHNPFSQLGEDEFPEGGTMFLETGAAQLSFKSIPDAPAWKDIQKVDITDLDWPDKERVIRILFKRLRQQQQHVIRKAASKESEDSLSVHGGKSGVGLEDADPASLVFLTQQ